MKWLLPAALAAMALQAQSQTEEKKVQKHVEVMVHAEEGANDVIMTRPHAMGVVGVAGDNMQFVAHEFSFEGAVVKNAPYAAEAVTETTQVLADGNRIVHKSSAMQYRDSEGRTRREVKFDLPRGKEGDEVPQLAFINDPVAKVNYSLELHKKTARKMPSPDVMAFRSSSIEAVPAGRVERTFERRIEIRSTGGAGPTAATAAVAATPGTFFSMSTGALEHGKDAKTESLGKRSVEGVECEGTKTTATIAAGEIGNERPIEIVSERWYSPELKMVVMSRRSDPRTGETVYRLSNLGRTEQLKSLFEVPADFTVQEEKIRVRSLPDKKRDNI